MEPSNNNANSFDKEQPINGSGDQAPASPSLITPAQVTITPNFTSTAPAQQPAQLFASDNPTQYQPLPTKGFGGGRDKKKVIFGALAALLIIGGSLGYAFGFYLPNKPANVFNTGLGRSSKAVTKLVNEFGSTEKLQKLQNSQITANADVKSSAFNVTGLLDLKLSKTKSDGSLDLKLRSGDDAQKNLSLKFLSDFPSDKQFPNLYLQVSGLSALGLGAFIPDLATYEGKWIAVDSDYLASLGSGLDAPKNKENVTSEEIAQLIKTVSATTNEYLLSSDKDKAVLVNKAFIGREKVDGIDSYHYQVGINKSNLKKFCKVLSERVNTSAAAKKFLNSDDKDAQDRKKDVDKSCDQDIDREIKDSETLDMWIDAKYKLIHKIRAYVEQDKNTYVDFGQIYTGGDKISLFVVYHQQESKVDAKFSIDLDIKKLTSKGEFVLTGKGGDDIDAKITFDAKPYAGDIKADKPSGAINIQDILQKLGYGSSE